MTIRSAIQQIIEVPDGKVVSWQAMDSGPEIRDPICRMHVAPYDAEPPNQCGKEATVHLVHRRGWIDWWCEEHAASLLRPYEAASA